MNTARIEHKTVNLDVYEEGAVINGLNLLRTEQLERGESADFVSDVMLKIIDTPARKAQFWGPHASPAQRVAWGEEAQRSEADTRRMAGVAERSLRRRDEAR